MDKRAKKEFLIIERLKLMTEFDPFIFDNIMNDVDFFVLNSSLKVLIMLYKNNDIEEIRTMNLINDL